MAIITPSENTYYCIGSGSATWFVNNNQLISFNQIDLINGTKFVKQNVNGSAFKITWDGGGSGKEHIINNPNNYSYSFKAVSTTGRYIFSNQNENLFIRAAGNYITGIGFYWNQFSDKTEFLLNNTTQRYLYLPSYGICGILEDKHFVVGGGGTYLTPENLNGRTGKITPPYNQLYDTGGEIIKLYGSYQWKIVIKDNNINYEYNIIDRNSVQIIYSQGGIKYTFSANMQSISQTYQTTQIIALKCGLDCPPDSCVKCRDGDFVCCYGGNGTVIERIYDPNFEIEAC